MSRRVLTALAACLLLATATSSATAGGRESLVFCAPFSIGPAGYSEIVAGGVACPAVRTLLDRTTLTTVRRGRKVWRFRGYLWRFRGINEQEARIIGVSGTRVISARFGVS